ncbi:hypothetical protein KS527_004677 [Salmonella enterica]|nr:hypothetical protein [Salmonella enterica]EJF7575643.1 hypothetical protein [Salmonella enterica subsp. enterica]
MAALVTLTDEQKARLPKLVNNLNFAIRNHNVGQLFTDVLAGTNKRHLDIRETREIQRLLNLINLGTYHSKFGDLFVDLLQANTISLTLHQKDDLVRALNKLNITLTRLQFGQLAGDAIKPAVKTPAGTTNPPAAKPTVTAGAAPTGKIVGDSLTLNTLFTFANSQASEYTFDATPAGSATITWPNAKLTKAGSVTIKATHKTDATATATLTLTVAAPKATITAKTPPAGKASGDTVAAGDLFTFGNSTDADYTYVADPAASADVTNPKSIKLSATGNVKITATNKVDAQTNANVTIAVS